MRRFLGSGSFRSIPGALAPGLCLLTLLVPAVPVAAKPKAPVWLTEAASLAMPAYDAKVPAVVLLDEESLTLDPSGKIEGTARYAVRILRYEGREHARAQRYYRTDGGGIHRLDAWLIGPRGEVSEYGKDQAIDAAAALNDVYNEERIRFVDASGEADQGSVFGFEVSFEQRTFCGQFQWSFQGELPTLRSRFMLALPPAWTAKGLTFNHAPVASTFNGSAYTWELRDLPWIEDELLRPPVTSLAPRLVVDAAPTDPGTRPPSIASYGSWTGVAEWLEQLSAPSAMPDPALESKARLLASGSQTTLDRVRAIGRYVQGLAYIAIQLGVSRGGGYRPHPAAQVFAKSYGDCKDKANLMKTMLRSVGVESYLAVIRSNDPAYVREEWPSPGQFDHCILAVRADAESSAAAVTHPALGSLIFFDPTDPTTPFGDLPEDEQGGLSLLIKEGGGLVRTPVASPDRNLLERRIEAELDSTGTVLGMIEERSRGREAIVERRQFQAMTSEAYQRTVEAWVRGGLSKATVSKVLTRDLESGNRFELDLTFRSPGYAQVVANGLMVFKPALVSRQERLTLTEPSRKYPVMLRGRTFVENEGTKLPSGFAVEELPPPVSLESSFGSYSSSAEVREGKLLYRRSLVLRTMPVPASEYGSLRAFFERVRTAEAAPVVLSRRPG